MPESPPELFHSEFIITATAVAVHPAEPTLDPADLEDDEEQL